MPIIDYPWKTSRPRTNPKCDFYLSLINTYIKVKGFTGIEAMSKISDLTKQIFNYDVFQGTELEWNLNISSKTVVENIPFSSLSKSKHLQVNIEM